MIGVRTLIVVLSLSLHGAAEEPAPTFRDVTSKAGLDAARGGRVAWGDYNNDGRDDLLVNGIRLFKNNGDGTFADVTSSVNLGGPGEGGVWADMDNDGFLDILVIGGQGARCALWKNHGGKTFENVTTAMNFDDPANMPTEGAAWGDYNRDGFVDLYLANFESPGEKNLGKGNPDALWTNCEGKQFWNSTAIAGIRVPLEGCGRGVTWADYDNDGLLDIYVSNYRLHPNFLWKNNGNGTFREVATATGCRGDETPGVFGHTIGSAWGDFDGDGRLDLLCGQLAHPRFRTKLRHPMTVLYKNQGPNGWKFANLNAGGKAGIAYEETHSSPAAADYDNDGFLDFYLTSCYGGRPSFLYRNRGDMTFADVTEKSGARVSGSWGCAWADIDNDGDMDLAVAGVGNDGRIVLLRNETASGNRWIEVRLEGRDGCCNRAAIGARVTVKAGDRTVMREIEGGTGTTCQNSLTSHFGLGGHAGPVTIVVRWPCGKTTETSSEVNKQVLLKEE